MQCKNTALQDRKYCNVHFKNLNLDQFLLPVGSALVGFAVMPTTAAAIIGAAVGVTLEKKFKRKTKVFVSFDFHHDRRLKTLIINQAKDPRSNFDIIDTSLVEAAPEKLWEKKAEALIRKADIVLVITGEYTLSAQGVLKEIDIAKQYDKKIVQILGYQNKHCRPIKRAGRVYKWNWENLSKLLN